jgi:hypothetical protein
MMNAKVRGSRVARGWKIEDSGEEMAGDGVNPLLLPLLTTDY